MRHADAEETRAVRDHDRPVTPAGAAAAADVARQLASSGWVPQVLVCSNAARSRQTLDEMRRALPALGDADEHVLGSLYTTSQLDGQTRGHLAEIVAAEAEDGHACVLCLGHNKGWSEAASAFAVSAAGV
jgi:phosphohistidine phosphatase SixA